MKKQHSGIDKQLKNIQPVSIPFGAKQKLFWKLVRKAVFGDDWGHFSLGLKPAYAMVPLCLIIAVGVFWNQPTDIQTPLPTAPIAKVAVQEEVENFTSVAVSQAANTSAKVSEYLSRANNARDQLLAKIEEDPSILSKLNKEQLAMVYSHTL